MQKSANETFAQDSAWPRQLTIGCIIGLVLGCIATVDAFLLRDRVSSQQTTASKAAPNGAPPVKEIADYLEGKSIPAQFIPAAGGTAAQLQETLVIHRSGIRDLRWQGASKPETAASEPWYHDYALLYSVGPEVYVADISIRLRQVGDQRAFLGYEVKRVEKADRIAPSR